MKYNDERVLRNAPFLSPVRNHSVPDKLEVVGKNVKWEMGNWKWEIELAAAARIIKAATTLSHDHHFKWWFEISPIRANYLHA